MRFVALASLGVLGMIVLGQAPPPAAAPKPAPKPAAAKPAAAPSQVDSVIQSVKAGLSESLIIRTLQRDNKPANLTTADLVKLKSAGVSENIISVMLDPAAPVAPAAAAAPAPAPAAAPAPEPAPAPVAVSAAPPPPPTAAQLQAQKKRVIVDEFDYSTVKTRCRRSSTRSRISARASAPCWSSASRTPTTWWWWSAPRCNTLMKEQDFNASNRVKQGSGARVGQISGADAMLSGDIVVFGRDDKKRSVRGGGLIGGVIGGIASSKNEDKAVVVIDYRLIDAETSEVIATGEAQAANPCAKGARWEPWRRARQRRRGSSGGHDQLQFRRDDYR